MKSGHFDGSHARGAGAIPWPPARAPLLGGGLLGGGHARSPTAESTLQRRVAMPLRMAARHSRSRQLFGTKWVKRCTQIDEEPKIMTSHAAATGIVMIRRIVS